MTVHLNNLEFYAYHGVPDAEQEVGHRYRISADLHLADCPAMESDSIEDTLDYAKAAAVIQAAVTGPQLRTIERLAGLLADELLDAFPMLGQVDLRVEKIAPPMPFLLESVGVSLSRRRDQGK
jgi:dihydroneopterin aldolase